MPTSPRTVILCTVTVIAVMCIPIAMKLFWGVPTDALLRDTNAVLGAPAYVGAISTLGLLLWAVVAAVCVFAAMAVPAARAFWLTAASIAALLLADDWLMLHENARELFGVPEVTILAVHGAVIVVYLVNYAGLLLRAERVLLLAALAGFAGSLAVDLVDAVFTFRGIFLAEDGLKLAGIVFWLVFHTRLALAFVREPHIWPARVRAPHQDAVTRPANRPVTG